ncbi:MAG: flagellar brake protein [Nitrosomonadales bacterium]|nr:flagellar brake protein [Nitrosomonadales bacterium]
MKRPENLLFRSHIEIVRLMKVLAQEGCKLSAELKGGHPFASSIVAFDPDTERFAIAYSLHKQTNAMVLASSSLEFTATDRMGLHYTFEAVSPEETKIGGQPAIQFALPKALYLHNQRELPRTSVPAELSLRCVADEGGFIPFESHVIDISHDGLGCLVYDPGINLEPGMMLKDCRIIMNNGDAVIADLELRHITRTVLADGTPIQRAGFRFAQKTQEQDKLIGVFIKVLDKQ